jgi:hypothetical protein
MQKNVSTGDHTMSSKPQVILKDVYDILIWTARVKETISYTRLSEEYRSKKHTYYPPRGTWDVPLGEINNILYAYSNEFPALSAVVVHKPSYPGEETLPGDGFWGCCPNVPPKPPTLDEQKDVHRRILRMVWDTKWPDRLPPDKRNRP